MAVAEHAAQDGPPHQFWKAHAAQDGPPHQFWKAGEYDIRPTTTKTIQDGPHKIKIHPKFLHSNATSHKWALGATAELLDNAVDAIQNGATYVSVDSIRNPRDNSSALVVQDDGGGMDPDCMRHCMCLGYSQRNKRHTIGQYGNGFKTSAMCLGADVVVFSSSNHNRDQHCELIGYEKRIENNNMPKNSARSLLPINQASISTGSSPFPEA